MTVILINTVSREDLINRVEIAAGLQVDPVKGTKREGTAEEKAFAASLPQPEIDGKAFPREQWIHVEDAWVEKNADMLAKYPDLKEPHVILEAGLKQRICECGYHNFAQGMVDAAKLYGTEVPEIAAAVLKIAPVEVKVEEG